MPPVIRKLFGRMPYSNLRIIPDEGFGYKAVTTTAKDQRPWLSWIERQTTNLNVGGSNPPGRTK
jgi:hypothetical protein